MWVSERKQVRDQAKLERASGQSEYPIGEIETWVKMVHARSAVCDGLHVACAGCNHRQRRSRESKACAGWGAVAIQ